MVLKTYKYTNVWNESFDASLNTQNSLVLIFADIHKSKLQEPIKQLVDFFSHSIVMGASTAGEILEDELFSGTIIATVISFTHTRLKVSSKELNTNNNSYSSGISIAKDLIAEDLKAVFVLSDGLQTNGSQLTKALSKELGTDIIVTGGLAGDDYLADKTFVMVKGEFKSSHVSAVGFYGEAIRVSHGSAGGWDTLGIKYLVTKSKDNILYELDSQPALDIYKEYLGERASELPLVGAYFPFELSNPKKQSHSVIRAVLAVDENEKSIYFGGDVIEGSYATLMRGNYDRLIDGATSAAEQASLVGYNNQELLSIAISCSGRKIVLKQRAEEELEAILDVLPNTTKQIGFYSYGEISPLDSGVCDLHNETMTLTLLWEDDA